MRVRMTGPIIEARGERFLVDASAGRLRRMVVARRAACLRGSLVVGSVAVVELLLYEPGQARIVGIATP